MLMNTGKDMETAANFGQTIEGIVALLTLIGGLIALYWRIIIKINVYLYN